MLLSLIARVRSLVAKSISSARRTAVEMHAYLRGSLGWMQSRNKAVRPQPRVLRRSIEMRELSR